MANSGEQDHGKTGEGTVSNNKPVVVGIYGLPGSGKTFLLRQLEDELGQEYFEFYEGSKVIDSVVPGGFSEFRRLPEEEKTTWRELAISTIRKECLESGKLGLVTGHLMFWPEGEDDVHSVHTTEDLNTYTHIIYLDVTADIIARRREEDTERARPAVSVDHLRTWQKAEIAKMRQLCRNHDILFCSLSTQDSLITRASRMIRDFRHHTEMHNLSRAEARLDEILGIDTKLQIMLVMDADRTLAAEDTGKMFWETVSRSGQHTQQLKGLFDGPMGYTYAAFRQAVLLYEEVASDEDFEKFCTIVASAVTIHDEFILLLRVVAEQYDVGAVVVTCGLRRVWEKVLEKEGLSGLVQVIGGGRISDGLVVTAAVKAALVSRLKNVYRMYVLAFGDSPLDLPMLIKADESIIVVGRESTRSQTMDVALIKAIELDGLRASQVLLPSDTSPRLDVDKLPLTQISKLKVIDYVLRRHRTKISHDTQLYDATTKHAAKLLMTPTRDASIRGPNLRKAHRYIGRYLATEALPQFVGLEEYPISHVQGHLTSGFRLRNEQHTLIVSLMRGGEPMAFGVSDALPNAMFIHAKGPNDLFKEHINGRKIIILVDSVVNSGNTVVQFVNHIRILHPTIRIIIVASVLHQQCIREGGLASMLADDTEIKVIALRLSDNRFTGKGATDTGNRLFNTTHLA
ncbi:uracil phosphoribosyltransferase-domain-containing protein [Xylaria cf. heliscus]|nr:uracil phosphoribosyltransferase-domain-containing protein [Xylaria cf. heliscus]